MTDGAAEAAGRRVHVPIPVRWGDLDAFQHVNNAAVLTFLEEARVRAFWAPEEGGAEYPTAVVAPSSDTGMLTLVARHEIEYLHPIPYSREPLDVHLWFGRLGGSSAEVCYQVCSPRGAGEQTVYVRAATVVVLVDASTGRPARMTAEMRAAWEPFIGEPIAFTRR